MWSPTPSNCDSYLSAHGDRRARYEGRSVRYRAAINIMQHYGLDDGMTVMDIGAGWTELDFCLRRDYSWMGRYYPVDGGLDGTDLNSWSPTREVEWVVALEILEHLRMPYMLLEKLKAVATKGIIISTPNPAVCDVLGMDETHVTPIDTAHLAVVGLTTQEVMLYEGRYSNGQVDGLLGWWLNDKG